MKRMLRWVGLGMLLVAVVFLAYAFTHPEAGSVFYIGNWAVGSDEWRIFYLVYAAVTVGLLVASRRK